MQEEFLFYIWQTANFNVQNLCTTTGENITIINKGALNSHAGPDFLNCRLKIGETEWAGNIEIHIKSSDWLKHGHQTDTSYDNTILHVVYQNDVEIFRTDGSTIPCLELKHKIADEVISNYLKLQKSMDWIPCQKQLSKVDALITNQAIDRALVNRLERKCAETEDLLTRTRSDWQTVFYISLCRNMGFKVNSIPFEQLANGLPLHILAKHKNNSIQIEALFFGQAGFLNGSFKDEYPKKLQTEYRFLKEKYGLQTMNPKSFKFMRLRPQNFPSIRLAQMASIVAHSSHLFSKITEETNLENIKSFFTQPVNDYWKSHYRFDTAVKAHSNNLGEQAAENIIINTIVPVLFAYASSRDQEILRQRALEFLGSLPAENNTITRKFNALNLSNKNAFESQGLIELKNEWCTNKLCIKCPIGNYLIKGN